MQSIFVPIHGGGGAEIHGAEIHGGMDTHGAGIHGDRNTHGAGIHGS